MKGVRALGAGLRAAGRNSRLVGWLLLANIALAVVAVYPLMEPLDETLSHHPAASEMARRLDMPWWVDVTSARAEAFARSLDLIGLSAFLAALMGCFFAGGLLQTYHDTIDRVPVERFTSGCRLWFARFVWLFALTLPLYWLVHRMINTHLYLAVDGVLERVDDERIGLALELSRALVFLVLFDLVTLVGDYARVHAVTRRDRSMLSSLSAGLRFVVTHPLRVWSLEAGAIALQVVALTAFLPIDAMMLRDTPATLAAGIVATQIYVFIRLLLREGCRAGQIVIYREAAPQNP